MRRALKPYQARHPYFLFQFLASRFSGWTGHRLGCKFPRHSKLVAAEQMLPKEFFDSLFKFAFVRNPWDLQVSSWHHLQRERPELLTEVPDFETFIQWKLSAERPYQYHIDTSIERQTDYLIDLHGTIRTDFIGRYENLQADFDQVCERVGVPRRKLPHKRKATDRKGYQAYYDAELADLVGSYFARDIEAFGYEF